MEEKECGCGCGCGSSGEHNHNHFEDEEMETMFLTLDDDTEVECGILGVFTVEEQDYIALLPINDDTVLIYKYKETEDDVELDTIDDDSEFEKVSNAFYEFYDEDDDEDEHGHDGHDHGCGCGCE